MPLYTGATRSTITTTAAATGEIRAVSGIPIRVREIGLTNGAATASVYGLGRPAAIGITPTTPVTVVPMNPMDAAGNSLLAIAWATPPTAPTTFMRRIGLPGVIGAGVIWTFGPNELIVGPGNAAAGIASLVLWNLATNSAALDWYAVVEE